MTAHTNIQADAQGDIIALAHAVAAGHWPTQLQVEYTTYSDEDWKRAADYVIDTGDTSEFQYMMDRESENDREERAAWANERRNYNKPLPMFRVPL